MSLKLKNSFTHENINSVKENLVEDTTIINIIIVSHNISKVCSYYETTGLIISEVSDFDIKLTGDVKLFSSIFNTKFYYHIYKNKKCYATDSEIEIPVDLEDSIIGVLGLETYPILVPFFKINDTPPTTIGTSANYTSFKPNQVAQIYNFPGSNGYGQKIGIIQLGGAFSQSDLNTYFSTIGLGVAPTIRVVLVDTATQIDDDASTEVALDVDIIAAIVPYADITIYFGVNSMLGFYNVIKLAGQNSNIVSISWGLDESSGLNASGYMNSYQILFQILNIPIFVASGDTGSSGMSGIVNIVGFPASVPSAIACGGTTLNYNGTSIVSKTGWRYSGGGYSKYYNKPVYQKNIPINMRGVPDVAGNADPKTGYEIYKSGMIVVGGTSAVSPLWTALMAQINQNLSSPLTLINTMLYSLVNPAFTDIVSGSNGTYFSSVGWDPVTGLGTPNGNTMLNQILSPSGFTVTSISPISGPYTGNTLVTIYGTGLTQVTSVLFGGIFANIVSVTSTTVTLYTPASNVLGTVNVVISNTTNSVTKTFTYLNVLPTISSILPAAGPISESIDVTILGNNLQFITNVTFGTQTAKILSKTNKSVIVANPIVNTP